MKITPWESGYCTNVHAGIDWLGIRANLEKHSLGVKQKVSPKEPMGVGLWIPAPALGLDRPASERQSAVEGLRDWLGEVGLVPFTLNGFPYGDFHQAVVKHRVYEPTWADDARLGYTRTLVEVLHQLLPAGLEGSISTLPITWGDPQPAPAMIQQAVKNLLTIADDLARLEQEQGRLITLCLEPEPGCYLQRKDDIVRLFQDHLFRQGDPERVRRYLRVCHDVCHSVVMFEPQAEVLKTYRDAGILVGKVQVSSAIRVPFGQLAPSDRPAALEQLRAFAEDRYLHQTVVRDAAGRTQFFEDLPPLLQTIEDARQLSGEWRIHFHVPIYLEKFGHLLSSRDDIQDCLNAVEQYSQVRHFEVETYAWGVLPGDLRQPDLASGIAQEMAWFGRTIAGAVA